jgi:hypothetical protein
VAGDDTQETRSRLSEARRCLDDALGIYFQLEADPVYRDDPIVSLRIADVFSSVDETALSLEYYRKAFCHMDVLPAQHYLRAVIPRRYGLALWEEARRMERVGKRIENPRFRVEERLELYLKAFEVTSAAADVEIDPSSSDWFATDSAREQAITSNNLLDYGVEYIRLGGDPDKVAALGFTAEFARKRLEEMGQPSRPAFADTGRLVAQFVGDKNRSRYYAEQVLALLRQKDWSLAYSPEVIEEMKEAAAETLREFSDDDAGR